MNRSSRLSPLAALVLASMSMSLVSCQFLPQSHLGRLVQSFTSPIVLQSGGSSDSSDGSDSYDSNSPYYGPNDSADQADQPSQQHQARPTGRSQYQNQERALQTARLQQAPSQQRGVPQQYYGAGNDEDQADQGSAPSSPGRHTQEYQMGADLGPTIDDKEMQGVFNSNNDERDDDDGAPAGAGYGPMGGSSGGRSRAASNSAYAPSSPNRYRGPAQDDDAADEEDEQPARGSNGRRNRARNGYLNQAASQYRQRPSAVGGESSRHGQSQDSNGPMLAAANGYAPYGYANGPVDLSSMMAAGMGGPNFGPTQMFQGDGSYPGANYYQQQAASAGRGQRGARNQAESASNGYYNGQGYARPGASEASAAGQRGDGDEGESEADDDRRRRA